MLTPPEEKEGERKQEGRKEGIFFITLKAFFVSLYNNGPHRLVSRGQQHKGPSIYDVRKILGFFDPPGPHLGLIYSTKFTQPPLAYYIFKWANPPSPSEQTSYMDAP